MKKHPLIPSGIDPLKSIWLPGHVPSSKNSKQIGFYYKSKDNQTGSWFFKKATKEHPEGEFKAITPSLRSSDQTDKYVSHIVQHIIDNKKRFKELVKDVPKPYIIQLHFVRKTRAMFDFGNAVEAIADAISGSFWKRHDKIPQIITQWIDVDDIANVVFIPVLENMLTGKPIYSVDGDNPGVWISVLDTTKQIMGFIPQSQIEPKSANLQTSLFPDTTILTSKDEFMEELKGIKPQWRVRRKI